MNVSLTPELEKLVAKRVDSGMYNSASEVVRVALRLLEQREQEDKARIEWLRGAVQEGADDISRGQFVALGTDREIGDFVDRARRRVTTKLAKRSRG